MKKARRNQKGQVVWIVYTGNMKKNDVIEVDYGDNIGNVFVPIHASLLKIIDTPNYPASFLKMKKLKDQNMIKDAEGSLIDVTSVAQL
jgi:ribosomal 30S subunit maturation factor RimM